MARDQERIRDPERGERILAAAVELIARRGYLGVNLKEIGDAAGITGSGIYRHFDTKSAILVALFDRVVDRLVADSEAMLRDEVRPVVSLSRLVRGQIQFTLEERALCEVYLQESRNLPAQDLRRLKWKQRHYVDLWQDLLLSIHPHLGLGEAQMRVHAAIATVHSVLRYHPHLQGDELEASLFVVACHVLDIDGDPGSGRLAVEIEADLDGELDTAEAG